MCSHYEPMADNDTPGAWPIWTQGSRLVGIIKGLTKHYFTQKYKSSGPHGFREEDFLSFFFPIISLWRPMTPGAWPTWTPGV